MFKPIRWFACFSGFHKVKRHSTVLVRDSFGSVEGMSWWDGCDYCPRFWHFSEWWVSYKAHDYYYRGKKDPFFTH